MSRDKSKHSCGSLVRSLAREIIFVQEKWGMTYNGSGLGDSGGRGNVKLNLFCNVNKAIFCQLNLGKS